MENKIYSTKLFFMLGSGRSGTQLISTLLNEADNAFVFHEPNALEDRSVLKSIYKDRHTAERYFNNYRKYEIYRRILKYDCNIYGEITGMLRYSVNQLKQTYPDARFFILARDGRNVIRSIYKWNFYKNYSFGAKNITPLL